MSLADFFSPDYASAQERFLAAAGSLGLPVDSHCFAARGPAGEKLFLDAARLGPIDAARVVVVSSGLHGVEGFLGSTVQLAWLERQAHRPCRPLPPATALLFLHALNPYGFAALRRGNENNVDLNRNFLDDRAFLDSDPAYRESLAVYERLAPLLNPASPPPPIDAFLLRALLHLRAEGACARAGLRDGERPSRLDLPGLVRLGLGELRKTLPVGQYAHPAGLFYGGGRAEESTRVLREGLPRWAAGAREVLQLDFHTGLGARGECRLHGVDPAGSAREAWASRHFGADRVEPWGGRTAQPRSAYCARGLMTAELRERLRPGTRYDGLTAEFGTCSALRVLAALRAENRAHFHAVPDSRAWRAAKAEIREVFCPADPGWREGTVRQGLELVDRALAIPPRPPASASD